MRKRTSTNSDRQLRILWQTVAIRYIQKGIFSETSLWSHVFSFLGWRIGTYDVQEVLSGGPEKE